MNDDLVPEDDRNILDRMRFELRWRWEEFRLARLNRIVCFFKGHERRYQVREPWDYEPERCWRCMKEWPGDDNRTLPVALNGLYISMVERDTEWFNRLDQWLIINHPEWLPDWWEY